MNPVRAALAIVMVAAAIALVWLLLETPNDAMREPSAPGAESSASAAASRPAAPASRPALRIPRGAESRLAGRPGAGPRVVGRVVTSRDRDPVPKAWIELRIEEREGRGFFGPLGFQTDVNGRFAFNVKASATLLKLDVESPSHVGGMRYEVEGPFEGDRDVGDLELAGFSTVWFRVVRADDTPIAGALARSEGGESPVLVEADADGRGSIDIDPDVKNLKFGAKGYELVDVPVPSTEELLTVKLLPCSSLLIQVTTAAGEPMPDTTRIRIQARDKIHQMWGSDPWFDEYGNSNHNNERSDRSLYTGSTLTVCPVRPGVRIAITVIEQLRNEELRDEVEVAPGEAKVVKFTLNGLFGRLKGRVVGEKDEPIREAKVLLGKDDITRITDAKGEFDYGAVPAEIVDLRVSTPTHGFWHRPEHRVAPGADPLLVRLEPGLPVKVKLVDDDGTPIKGASVYACDRFGITDAEGHVSLPHLPRETVTIESFFASVRWDHAHDPSTPVATIRMENVKRSGR